MPTSSTGSPTHLRRIRARSRRRRPIRGSAATDGRRRTRRTTRGTSGAARSGRRARARRLNSVGGAWSWRSDCSKVGRCRCSSLMAQSAARVSTSTSATRPIRPTSARSMAGCSGARSRRGSRTASVRSSGIRARATRARTVQPAATAGRPISSSSWRWLAAGSAISRTCSTTTSSRSGRTPARWADATAQATGCANGSGRCRGSSPT